MPKLTNAPRVRPAKRIVPKANPPIDTRLLITEDDEPVDSMYVDDQQTLLKEVLKNFWKAPDGKPFRVMCDVGLFFEDDPDHPFSPDIMLATDFPPANIHHHDHRSYFTWIVGKVPDVVIEIVSREPKGEDTTKLQQYEFRGIPNYVIYDPLNRLKGGKLRVYRLGRKKYRLNSAGTFPEVGLGVKMWHGVYGGSEDSWLRWCDLKGNVIPTGDERAETLKGAAKRRLETEREAKEEAQKEAKRLADKLRALGYKP